MRLALASLSFALLAVAPASAQEVRIHVTAEGETLADVARFYSDRITASDLVRWNRVDVQAPLPEGSHVCLGPCGSTHSLQSDTDVWSGADVGVTTVTVVDSVDGFDAEWSAAESAVVVEEGGWSRHAQSIVDVQWGDVQFQITVGGSLPVWMSLGDGTETFVVDPSASELRGWADAIETMSEERRDVGPGDVVRLERSLFNYETGINLVLVRTVQQRGSEYRLSTQSGGENEVWVVLTQARLRSLVLDLRAAADALDESRGDGLEGTSTM